MPHINGVKLACATCIKGHRSSSCAHDDRPLFEVKKKGRPSAQCTKCKDQRKGDKASLKCVCGSSAVQKDGPPPRKLKKGERAPLPKEAHYPNGLRDAYTTLLPQQQQVQKSGEPSTISLERLMNPCKCKVGGQCNCSERKRAFMSTVLPSISDVIGECSCGPSCACPGCLTHGNPPLPAEEQQQAQPDAAGTCGCDEIDVQQLLKKTECGNLEEFVHKASALVPHPPQGLSSNISSYVDGRTFGLQSWQQLYDPRNKGITRLPPLETECCGGSCQCQALGVACRCEESCCGCCTSCNCEDGVDKTGSGKGRAPSLTVNIPPPPPQEPTPSCCAKPQLSPTSLTAAISQPGGLKIPQQLISPQMGNHYFPKYIPHREGQPTTGTPQMYGYL